MKGRCKKAVFCFLFSVKEMPLPLAGLRVRLFFLVFLAQAKACGYRKEAFEYGWE
jgi:hypothetical protein